MVKIINGSLKKFIVRLKLASTGDPVDLSTVTEITTCFKKSDDTELMLSLTGSGITIIDSILGKIQIALLDTETADLIEVDSETLELALDFGDGPNKLQIPKAYSVIPAIC